VSGIRSVLPPDDGSWVPIRARGLERLLRIEVSARSLSEFDPEPHDPADAAWIFQQFIASLRVALVEDVS
jgi:hypothetical protein